MNNPSLILLVGPPGSGKSTKAKKLLNSKFVYINQDSQGKYGHIEIFNQALTDNKNIIVDRLNFSIEQRNRYLNPARMKSYNTKIIVLHESYENCLERCINRQNHETIKNEVDAKSALKTFFTKYERVQDSEANEVIRVWPDRYKPKAIWVDIDNTASDCSHRQAILSPDKAKRNWPEFFEKMEDDPYNEWCKHLMEGMSNYCLVLMCSARPEDYRDKTERWLKKHKVPYHELIMRWSKDFRDDSIVKEMMYEFEVKTRYNLLFVVDDRKKVIDQIRTHGVVVLDCAGEKGNF